MRYASDLSPLLIPVQRYEILSKSQLSGGWVVREAVVDTCAKIRNFKQITTSEQIYTYFTLLLIPVQRYEILSKSQLYRFRQNTNVVVDTCAKIRNFKQITTDVDRLLSRDVLLIPVQRYEILSKSQHERTPWTAPRRCWYLCKDTKF